MYDITFLNKNFRFVFQPKINVIDCIPALQFEKQRSDNRFLVGAGRLAHYITEKNAETVLKSALKMKTDKLSCKFRKYGKIDIYVK